MRLTDASMHSRRTRRTLSRQAGRLVATLLLALVTTLASVRIERRGPEQVEAGNLCGPRMDEICRVDALTGGWPIGYLVDSPNISVPNQLGFFEDHFRRGAFAMDFLVHWIVILALALLTRRITDVCLNRP